MDSLKTLMDNKQYELVIKLTENSIDSLALFYRLTAFLAIGQSEKALEVINTKKEILKSKLAMLIKFHIEILCLLGRFDEAYDELKIYEEMPYESQEVEEILRKMPSYIRNSEKELYARHSLDEEEIYKKLLSNKDEEVLIALDQIKDQRIDKYLIPLLKIIKSYPKQVIRTYALLLLVNQKYDKEVEFLYFGQLKKVIPSNLEEPFKIEGFKDINELSYALQSLYHDPSIAQNALHIISSYLLYIYPRSLELSKEEVLIVFGYLAKKLLRIDISDLKEACQSRGLDFNQISLKISQIDEDLKNF